MLCCDLHARNITHKIHYKLPQASPLLVALTKDVKQEFKFASAREAAESPMPRPKLHGCLQNGLP